jgi:hypothetical protein
MPKGPRLRPPRPPTRPSAKRTPIRIMPIGPRWILAWMSCARWGFNRSATLTRNPFGNTSKVGMTQTASSPSFNSTSTAKVAGSVPSDGRSQAGGDQRRSVGGEGGGKGSKKLTDRTGYRSHTATSRLTVTFTSNNPADGGHPLAAYGNLSRSGFRAPSERQL